VVVDEAGNAGCGGFAGGRRRAAPGAVGKVGRVGVARRAVVVGEKWGGGLGEGVPRWEGAAVSSSQEGRPVLPVRVAGETQ